MHFAVLFSLRVRFRVKSGLETGSWSGLGSGSGSGLGLGSGSGLELEEVFVFDSKSENRDRSVEAVEAVTEARAV